MQFSKIKRISDHIVIDFRVDHRVILSFFNDKSNKIHN